MQMDTSHKYWQVWTDGIETETRSEGDEVLWAAMSQAKLEKKQ